MNSLYHCTPTANLKSILKRGVDPAFSKGNLKACYWVSGIRLKWAVDHVSRRHRVPPEEVVVLHTDAAGIEVTLTQMSHCFRTRAVVPAVGLRVRTGRGVLHRVPLAEWLTETR